MNKYEIEIPKYLKQRESNISKEKKKSKSGIDYKNGKWRPNIFLPKDQKETIDKWLHENGYDTVNVYLLECLRKDGVIE